jgi:hypothetical protein
VLAFAGAVQLSAGSSLAVIVAEGSSGRRMVVSLTAGSDTFFVLGQFDDGTTACKYLECSTWQRPGVIPIQTPTPRPPSSPSTRGLG